MGAAGMNRRGFLFGAGATIAIDWSGPDLRLKSIFGAWRPIRR